MIILISNFLTDKENGVIRGALLLSLLLISCITVEKDIVIDTSNQGAINMIKVIGEDVFILNSTRSSIQKTDGDSLITIIDADIKGRDFVLDFILDGENVYLSNTYDEIFKLKGNSIVDTFKIFSSDKIAKVDDKLFVTSRVGNGILHMIDLKTKKVISKNLNKTKSEAKFAQTSLAVSNEKVYILNNSSDILTILDKYFEVLEEIYLPSEVDYGNISIIDGKPVILANENGKLAIYTVKNSQYVKNLTNIDISLIDLRTSAIDFSKVYLYDYIRGKIEIKKWNL